ncbi:MAG: glycine betaine ABC transporter substrate-binding protein [Egibacteraceae bacterium]
MSTAPHMHTRWRGLVALMVMALVMTACGTTDEGDDGGEGEDVSGEETPESGGEVALGWIPWEENIAATFMWKELLEQEGYEVTERQLDVAPVFAAVAGGDVDLMLDMWLPNTHAPYQEEFGEDIEDLGVWYDSATLELTVPAYVEEVDSLEDLAENADLFDGTITGIESGAGMMQILEDDVIPTYGLDEAFTLESSSTAAMRAELQRAYDAEEPIVVTLWTPHPEYGLKDLKRLEDPENAWGDEEQLHAISRTGFADDFPEVAEWISTWEMSDEELSSLNAAVEEAGDEPGDERENWQEAAASWIEDNRETVDEWIG